jgi:lipopolysaccharide transport system ATP-binding protein
MSSEPIIEIEALGKAYEVAPPWARHTTLRDALVNRLRHPLQPAHTETFWALRGLTMSVQPGEVIGVIGGNGAGKSTLLKMLCRITEPTEGVATLRGRIGSLLEVGTGFHPELTGRENVYLNGAILGMKRTEIDRRFDDIVEFSGVGPFLELPVKRYSSGMYVRLAFAVAAHLQPEILIVDEVLAVGDAEFQQKCLGQMEEAASQEGRTILFVSHNLAAVEALCTRAIYLDHGRVAYDGKVPETIRRYLSRGGSEVTAGHADLSTRTNPHQPDGRPIVEAVQLIDELGNLVSGVPIGSNICVRLRMRGFSRIPSPVVGVRVRDELNGVLTEATSRMTPLTFHEPRQELENVTLTIESVTFAPGEYWLDFGIKNGVEGTVADVGERVVRFSVVPTDFFGTGFQPTHHQGRVLVRHRWDVSAGVATPEG